VSDQDNGRRLRPANYCKKYDVSRTTLWRWIRDGKLPAERVDTMVFVPDRLPSSSEAPA
jgi:predicted site-specific integrase-resolvase